MATTGTEILVPRGNNQGAIGTNTKRWGEGHFQALQVNGVDVGGTPNLNGDTRITSAILRVDTMASLKTLPIPDANTSGRIELGGYYNLNDKPPVSYQWVAGSSLADNGGSVINPTGHTGNGRWLLLYNGTTHNVLDWGAKGDNSFDNTAIFQTVADHIATTTAYGTMYLPIGRYKFAGLRLGTSVDTNSQYNTSFISIIGEHKNGSELHYTGPSTGIAISFARNVFSRFEYFLLTNDTGVRGTSIGIQTAGFSFGNASQGNVFRQLNITGFHMGWHSSANTPPNLFSSPSSCSEMSWYDCFIGYNDFGMYLDDFNVLNIAVNSCDFQYNIVGAYAAIAGVVFTGCCGEYNHVDFKFANPTNNNGAIKIDGYRSENAGICVWSHLAVTLININVTNLTDTLNPGQPNEEVFKPSLSDLGISFPPYCPPSPLGYYQPYDQPSIVITGVGDGKGQSSLENCRIVGQIICGTPVDIQIKNTQVGTVGNDPIFFMFQNNQSPARYDIEGCVLSDIGMNDVFTRYPNRKGIYLNNTYNDTFRQQPLEKGIVLSSLKPSEIDFSLLPTSSTGVLPGHAYIDSGIVKIVPNPLQTLVNGAKANAVDYCLVMDPSLYTLKNGLALLHDPISQLNWFSSPDAASAADLTLVHDGSGPNGIPFLRAGGVRGTLHYPDPLGNGYPTTLAYYVAIFRSVTSTFNKDASIIDRTADDGAGPRGVFQNGTTAYNPYSGNQPIAVKKNGVVLSSSNYFDLGTITNWMVLTVQTNHPANGTSLGLFQQYGDGYNYQSRLNAELAAVIGWKTMPTTQQIANVTNLCGAYSGITITQ